MEILLLSIIISFASLGFRAITGKGMIFYFLRKPFDKLAERKKSIQESISTATSKRIEFKNEKNRLEKAKKEGESIVNEEKRFGILKDKIQVQTNILTLIASPNKYDWLLYIMKPFILCSTCMASVHTLIWFPILTGEFTYEVVLVMLIVAIFNTIIWSVVEYLEKE